MIVLKAYCFVILVLVCAAVVQDIIRRGGKL